MAAAKTANVVEFAIKDLVVCFLWVFISSCIGTGILLLTPFLGEDESIKIFVVMSMFIGLLTIFGALCEYLGGASFNPAGNICNYCAGVGNDSVLSMGVRIPAQAVGSALGAYAIWIAMPDQLKHSLTRARLAPGVDMYEGAFVEFALTLFINLLALYSMFGGVRSALVRTFLLIAGSVIVGALGGPYSGPSLNPANAFGWAYVEKSHNTTEHIYTFWTAPIVGTILAGIAFKVLLKPKEEKVKVKAS